MEGTFKITKSYTWQIGERVHRRDISVEADRLDDAANLMNVAEWDDKPRSFFNEQGRPTFRTPPGAA